MTLKMFAEQELYFPDKIVINKFEQHIWDQKVIGFLGKDYW